MGSEQSTISHSVTLGSEQAAQHGATLLQSVAGVIAVEAAGKAVQVRYDVMLTRWGNLCAVLARETGYAPRGVFARWRDGWRDFKDQNMRDNLTHRAACCSKPPPGAGRR